MKYSKIDEGENKQLYRDINANQVPTKLIRFSVELMSFLAVVIQLGQRGGGNGQTEFTSHRPLLFSRTGKISLYAEISCRATKERRSGRRGNYQFVGGWKLR